MVHHRSAVTWNENNCVFLVREDVFVRKRTNRTFSSTSYDVDTWTHTNVTIRRQYVERGLEQNMLPLSYTFPCTSTLASPRDSCSRLINYRVNLRVRGLGGNVLHFRCYRVREATDRTPRFSVLLGCSSVRLVSHRGCAMWKRERVRGFIDPRDQGRSRGENPVTSGNWDFPFEVANSA